MVLVAAEVDFGKVGVFGDRAGYSDFGPTGVGLLKHPFGEVAKLRE